MGSMIGIHQQAGVVTAYLAQPSDEVTRYRGAILLLHDIWGLTDHIKSVADRFANAGYYTLAPNLLYTSPEKQNMAAEIQKGLSDPRHEQRNEALRKFHALTSSTQTPQFVSLTLARVEACFEYIYNQPLARQKIAAVGFGFGGTYTFALAVRDSRLRAAIPFHGDAMHYHELELRHINCPVLAFYGSRDGISPEAVPLSIRMQRAGVRFTPIVYAGANASFFNDSNPETYDRVAAADAWKRTTSFLRLSLI